MMRSRATLFRGGTSSDGPVRREALTELFEVHYAHLWRYISRRAGPSVADELASEVFVQALGGRSRLLEAGSDARPWLYGIATNLLRGHVRSEQRRFRSYARAVQPVGTAGGLDGAEARLDSVSRGPAVARALASVTPAERDTLLLFALTELGYDGIATATGVPVGTVRSRLHRARRRLTEELEAEEARIAAADLRDRSIT